VKFPQAVKDIVLTRTDARTHGRTTTWHNPNT